MIPFADIGNGYIVYGQWSVRRDNNNNKRKFSNRAKFCSDVKQHNEPIPRGELVAGLSLWYIIMYSLHLTPPWIFFSGKANNGRTVFRHSNNPFHGGGVV